MSRFPSIFVALSGFMLLAVGSSYAQAEESLRVHIPFTFQVEGTILPPGQYALSMDAAETPGMLVVRSEDGRHAALALADQTDVPRASSPNASLVFVKEGSHYALAKVLDPSYGWGVEVPGTHVRPAEERG